MRGPSLIGVVCVWMTIASAAMAQEPLKPGARIRVVSENGSQPRPGSIVSDSPDGAVVRLDAGAIGVGEIRGADARVPHSRLEVLAKTRRRTGTGALVGGIAGFAAGWQAGVPLDEICSTSGSGYRSCDNLNDAASTILGVGGALVGAGIGALVGRAFKTEVWVPASAARAELTPMISPRAVGLSLHLRPR